MSFVESSLAPHSLLLDVRSFLSTQIAQSLMPLSRSQILEYVLGEVRIFLPKIPCCQSNGSRGPFCPDLAFLVLMLPVKNPMLCRPLHNPKTYMWLFPVCLPCTFDICHQCPATTLALHKFTENALCQIDQMNAYSFLLDIVSHKFPHFNLSLVRTMPCHLITTL